MKRLAALLIAAASLDATALDKFTTPPTIEIADPGSAGLRVGRSGVFGNFYPGKGKAPRPGLLVLGGSEGGLNRGASRMAQALAEQSFSVLQLCYFGCPGQPPRLVRVPLATFTRGLAWLRHRPGIDAARLGVMGGSKGSEAALLLATRELALKAVVATQTSSVAWPGITYTSRVEPGWTSGGKPIAFLPYAGPATGKGGIFAHYANALPALAAHPDAAIAVERIAAPILLVCGEADTLWPSCPMAQMIAARLKAHGRPPPLLLRYPDAGHEVFGRPIDRTNPAYARLGALGGSPRGIDAARADDWPQTIAFLKRNLGD